MPHAKKTTLQVETFTYSDKHKASQAMTVDEKEKGERFVFLIISARPAGGGSAMTYLALPDEKIGKSQICPTRFNQ